MQQLADSTASSPQPGRRPSSRITAAALAPLVGLPNLGWLAVDAKDDWMPYIAAMPRLRFLGARTRSRATTVSSR